MAEYKYIKKGVKGMPVSCRCWKLAHKNDFTDIDRFDKVPMALASNAIYIKCNICGEVLIFEEKSIK